MRGKNELLEEAKRRIAREESLKNAAMFRFVYFVIAVVAIGTVSWVTL